MVVTGWRTPGTRNLWEEVTPGNLDLWRRERRGPMASFGAEAGGFARSPDERPAPDLQLGAIPGPPPLPELGPPTERAAGTLAGAVHVRSRGQVTLASPDPGARPLVDPAYFADEADLEVLVAGVRMAREIAACEPLAGITDGELMPGADVDHADDPKGGATMTRPDMRQRQFVLGPERVRVTILTTGAETGGRHDFTDSWLPAGSMTPLHLHTRYEERIWVASGSLTVWACPDKVVLRSGDYHRIPTHVPHTIRSGPEDTHALHISTPAGFAELVARAGTPAHLLTPDTQPDLELFMAVTTELGDVVLGPPGTMPAAG